MGAWHHFGHTNLVNYLLRMSSGLQMDVILVTTAGYRLRTRCRSTLSPLHAWAHATPTSSSHRTSPKAHLWPTCTLTEKPSTCLVAACPPSLETVHTLLAYTVMAEHFLVTSLANRRRLRPHCVVPSIALIAGENFPPSFAGSNLRKPGYFPSHGRHNCKFEAYWCRRRPPLLASFSLCPCPSRSTHKTAVTWNQSPTPLHRCPSSQKHLAIVDVKKRGQE